MNKRYEVRQFEPELLDDAARLLAERHRRHRLDWPALAPAYEDPAAARALIAALVEKESPSGAFVYSGSEPAAYVLGVRKADSAWGPNVWVEDAGSAGSDPDAVRTAYASAAQRWVDEGRTSHYVVVPATDAAIVDAWFSLGFGLQHVHALRELPAPDFQVRAASGLVVRPAEERDVQALVDMDTVLPTHSGASPIFSPVPIPTPDESRDEILDDLTDARFAPFVAEHDGRVVGTATFCSLEVSNIITAMMRLVSAGFLGFAVVPPDARGLGAGRALADAVMVWSRDEGYEWVATDWRSTNIEANRTWRAAGFRPTFYRLFRSIA